MSEYPANTAYIPSDQLSAPLLFASSESLGWQGMVARAYQEPSHLDYWYDSAVAEPTLVLITRGALHMEFRGVKGRLHAMEAPAGTLFLKPGGSDANEVRWHGLASQQHQTLHLHLSQALLHQTAGEISGSEPTSLAIVGQSGFHDPLLTQLGFSVERELMQPSSAGKLYAESAAHLLAVHLLRHYAALPVTIPASSPRLTARQLQRVNDFVQAHLHEDISLAALAQQAGFSPYHFVRLFRQATGESPHQFVMRQRVAHAQHLLAATETPLAEIALTCGFASQSHFTHVFKRHLGLTPRVFRQEHAIRAQF